MLLLTVHISSAIAELLTTYSPPPSEETVLLPMTQLVSTKVPPTLQIPPPDWLTVLSVMVHVFSVTAELLAAYNPPPKTAVLLLMVHSVSVSVPPAL